MRVYLFLESRFKKAQELEDFLKGDFLDLAV